MLVNPSEINPIGTLETASPELAESFLAFRKQVHSLSALDKRQRELCLTAAFATLGDEKRLVVHGLRAVEAGATADEVRHAVLLMLGATTTLSTATDCLEVLSEVLDCSNP